MSQTWTTLNCSRKKQARWGNPDCDITIHFAEKSAKFLAPALCQVLYYMHEVPPCRGNESERGFSSGPVQ